VTQAVLGGAVTYAVLGRRLGKRAALYGLALGTLPDLDVLIDFGGPIEDMTNHRGFSHSFLVQALLTPVFAQLFSRMPFSRDASWTRWCVAVYLCFATHSLADFFTVYGTQIFWPLTDHPFTHSILFIVDPAFTVPLLVAVISALLMRDQHRALTLNAVMLGLSTLYLVWSTGAKWVIDDRIQRVLANRGISAQVYESTPAPLSTLLWRGVAVDGDQYFEIWASIFDEVDQIQISGFPRNRELLSPIANHPKIERLRWFTKGQYKAWRSDDQIIVSDLRMGIEGAYVFNFEVGRQIDNQTRVGSFQQLRQRFDLASLQAILARIFDPTVSISNPN
jgi:inner membrane protein